MHRRGTGFLIALLAVGIAACDKDPTAVACTLEARPGVRVTIQDSVTGASAASGATVMVTEGTFRDSVTVPAGRTDLDAVAVGAAYERAGSYTATVRKSGYLDWARSAVTVTSGECHVNTVSVVAKLKPAP